MCKKELSVCIWIHHIATFIGILEGMYYLLAGGQRFWRRCMIFVFTAFQTWAGYKVLMDIREGRSRLLDSYMNLKKLKNSREQERGLLWGIVLSSTLFKVFLVHILGQGRKDILTP